MPRLRCEANKKGDGLASQETRCREYARHKNYKIIEVFHDEGVSGSLIDRPSMQAMLKFLKKRKSEKIIVIIDDISRLARGVDTHLQLRMEISDAGGKLESPSIEFGEDSDSILVENLLPVFPSISGKKTPNRRKTVCRHGS